jgi:hypothetical protein
LSDAAVRISTKVTAYLRSHFVKVYSNRQLDAALTKFGRYSSGKNLVFGAVASWYHTANLFKQQALHPTERGMRSDPERASLGISEKFSESHSLIFSYTVAKIDFQTLVLEPALHAVDYCRTMHMCESMTFGRRS